MSIHCVAYVSSSLLKPEDAAAALQSLVDHARIRNREYQITGALLYSGSYFAQCLEGPIADVRAIMNDILSDTRHRDVRTFHEGESASRVFQSWTLAYRGPSLFVNDQLEALYSAIGSSHSDTAEARMVMRLMQELATDL